MVAKIRVNSKLSRIFAPHLSEKMDEGALAHFGRAFGSQSKGDRFDSGMLHNNSGLSRNNRDRVLEHHVKNKNNEK